MQIPIKLIKVESRLRSVDSKKVDELLQSIQEIGLLNPIIITKDNVLVAGAHRLEAMKRLGKDNIECNILETLDSLRIQLSEIDENLIRNDLDYLTRGEFLSKRKDVYEQLYPTTKSENNHTKASYSKIKKEGNITIQTLDSDKTPKSFVESTSKLTNQSKSKISEEIALSKNIIPEVKQIIKDKELPKVEAIQIAKLEPMQQKEVMKRISNGDAKKVKEAINQIHHEEQIQEFKESVPQQESLVKLLQGDFFEQIKQIPDHSIDLLFADPPYGILKVDWDDKTLDELRSFTEKWLIAIEPKLKPTSRMYICFSQWYEFELQKLLEKHQYLNMIHKQKIIWYYKNNNKPSNRKEYRYSYEPIFYLYGKEATELNFPPETYGEIQTNVWEIATPQSNFTEGKFHESQKPEELLRRIILTGSNIGDQILDPFAGSGTTGVLAQKLKRKCILIEQNHEYCQIAQGRINRGISN
jgi:site-specific DNA-methyltransferase (adenine-specific)